MRDRWLLEVSGILEKKQVESLSDAARRVVTERGAAMNRLDVALSRFNSELLALQAERSVDLARAEKAEAEVRRLRVVEQGSGENCPACGWNGIRGDSPCAFCAQDHDVHQSASDEVKSLRAACEREIKNTRDAEADAAALRECLREVMDERVSKVFDDDTSDGEICPVSEAIADDLRARAEALLAKAAPR